MPELPEVETTLRGVRPHLEGCTVAAVRVRNGALRWPVPPDLGSQISGRPIVALSRRGKYLLLHLPHGALLLHLGMSGSLRVVPIELPPRKHDHVDLLLSSGYALRFHDPRRFGSILWQPGPDPNRHPLLAHLGPEPFGPEFSGAYLHRRSRGRRVTVKGFIMDSGIVVGVGNIYACEALFAASIHPARVAGRVGATRYGHLAETIRNVLQAAIEAGGTTLRDFSDANGEPGYFSRELAAYGRAGDPCRRCGTAIRVVWIARRASYYCPRCQR
jgi:formamidopyrimidine-DNA glycosylase